MENGWRAGVAGSAEGEGPAGPAGPAAAVAAVSAAAAAVALGPGASMGQRSNASNGPMGVGRRQGAGRSGAPGDVGEAPLPLPGNGSTAFGVPASPVVVSLPVCFQGPKCGYLYIRLLEAGNLESLVRRGGCCSKSQSASSGCLGVCMCRASPAQLQVSFTCACLERMVNLSGTAALDPQTHKAVFSEEMLLRSLDFYASHRVKIQLQSRSTTLGEATVPLRAALPPPLGHGSLLHGDILDREAWLPQQRILLWPPGCHSTSSKETSTMPYLEIQMLQLVDNSLPKLLGTNPLLLAIEQRQEQLVKAYLSLDILDALTTQEQAACVSAAIQVGRAETLALLLDYLRPSHQHLLAAIQLRSVQHVELLLQAGGAPLLRPCHRGSSVGRLPTGSGGRGAAIRGNSRGETPTPRPGSSSANVPDGQQSAPSRSRPRRPALTPLAVACALGDVAMVEAICQWARREKVHVDPSAPLLLGADLPTASPLRGGAEGAPAAVAAATSPLWDHDDQSGENTGPSHGDPPMVMAVRSLACISAKRRVIQTLSQFGFAADVRSPIDSWTPLLAAVELGSLELATLLVFLGARLSADRHLGFTPLHLACQMGHWHLVTLLTEAMKAQYSRVAAWGPSPQYVSLNLVDSYGRTALDTALLRYFGNPLFSASDSGKSPASSSGNDRQKAVDILREFVHRSPPEDPGIVCGWELLRVLRFIEALPPEKAGSAQLWASAGFPGGPGSAVEDMGKGVPTGRRSREELPLQGDAEELLQAVRILVRAGAQTRWLLQDLLQPGGGSDSHSYSDSKENITAIRPSAHDRSPKFSAIDPDDIPEDVGSEAVVGALQVRPPRVSPGSVEARPGGS
mmetsp:Transcript_23213/g.51237  ORF Transcript_23213/g.51237 Transcript_23213/m.51237 type:complete len:854 (-) Transcript_23213:81-2642(-)